MKPLKKGDRLRLQAEAEFNKRLSEAGVLPKAPSGGGGMPSSFARGGSWGRDTATYGTPSAPAQESIPIGSFDEGRDLARQQGKQAALAKSSSLLNHPVGPAALQEVGPMFMENRYGKGMLNHLGPVSPMGGMPAGGMPGTSTQGYGQMFRGALSGQQTLPNPYGQSGQGQGMDPLEKAMLLATLLEAGGGIYGQYKAGKQADREYEDKKKREEEDDERRKAGGRLFGTMFRDSFGG